MRTTVKSAIAQLTDLKAEEKILRQRLDLNLHRQKAIMDTLQIKPQAPQRSTPTEQPASPARPSPQPPVRHSTDDKSGAARVREYVSGVRDDVLITTEKVATDLKLPNTIVSTALGRLVGTLIERAPNSKRGKFRKLSRAA